MADNSSIEWTDATWNPVTGCTEVSPGCDHCYAKTFAERWRGTPGHHFENGFDVTLRPERLDQPYRWRKPRRVFVNSMSDLFHDQVPDLFLTRVFEVMERTPQHTYQILTKRHARMRSFLRRRQQIREEYANAFADCPTEAMRTSPAAQDARHRADNPPANIWVGVSVEDQHWADIRISALLETPAAVRWLSCEPLLGTLDVAQYLTPGGCHTLANGESFPVLCNSPSCGTRVDWVVTGGESGPGARPAHPDWFRSLRDQCTTADVPFFFKQWGEWQDGSHDPRSQHGPDHVIHSDGRHVLWTDYQGSALARDHSRAGNRPVAIARVGKKGAGRELDGRTWDQYPTTATPVPA